MSKRLAKILSICLLAVILPLAAVATAITVTQAKNVTISVEQTEVDTTNSGVSSKVAIIIDGQEQEESTVVVRKNSKLTVKFTGEGFYFDGWYQAGSEKRLSDVGEREYTLVANSNKTLIAAREVQKYNITYTGKNADDSDVTTQAEDDVEYNTALPVLPASAAKIFAGWDWTGDDKVAPTFYANFVSPNPKAQLSQNAEVELEAIWKENAAYTVYYSVKDKSAENSYSMAYSATTGFAAYPKTRDGYTFKGLQIEGENKVYAYSDELKDFICGDEKLSDTLSKNISAVIYAVWESEYPAMYFAYEAVAEYEDPDLGVEKWGINGCKDGNYVSAMGHAKEIVISDYNGVDLQDNFKDYFLSGYSSFQTVEGETCVFTGNIIITDLSTSAHYEIEFGSNALVFKTVYSALAMSMDITDYSQLEGKSFTVRFMFDIIQ